MAKYTIEVEETLTYRREIEIETYLPTDELNHLLSTADSQSDTAEEIADYLNYYTDEVNVEDYPDSDLDSPWDFEAEVIDFKEED